MVELNYKVFMFGMVCLTIMYIACLIMGRDDTMIMTLISGFIGMIAGVMIPAPKTSKKGVLKW